MKNASTLTVNQEDNGVDQAKVPVTKFNKPPFLVGYTFEPYEAYKARDDGRLLAIRLETNRSCNLRCRYCYDQSGENLPDQLDISVLKTIVDQARDLGAESIVVIGGGEPTIHPEFRKLISHIHSLDMIPMIFSNCIEIDEDLAKFLFDHNASVMTKLDSLKPNVQDFMAGRKGSYRKIQKGINNLMDAGFGKPEEKRKLRIGASFVSCQLNVGEIDEIWHYCRNANIFPNMEVLTPTGRARQEMPDLGLTTEQVQEYKDRLLDIDRVFYGLDWLPHTPLAASGCLQHLYSMYVTIKGDVRPCAPTKFDEHDLLLEAGVYPHNILRKSLKGIYESPLFTYVRNIDKHLQGRCSDCEHNDECIGCRGYAYSFGVNQGLNPLAALRGECLQCSKEQSGESGCQQ